MCGGCFVVVVVVVSVNVGVLIVTIVVHVVFSCVHLFIES